MPMTWFLLAEGLVPDFLILLNLNVLHTFILGPTHDDITYKSLANAFGLELRYHEETLNLMKRQMLSKESPDAPSNVSEPSLPLDFQLNEARKRMALLPSPCLIFRIPNL